MEDDLRGQPLGSDFLDSNLDLLLCTYVTLGKLPSTCPPSVWCCLNRTGAAGNTKEGPKGALRPQGQGTRRLKQRRSLTSGENTCTTPGSLITRVPVPAEPHSSCDSLEKSALPNSNFTSEK